MHAYLDAHTYTSNAYLLYEDIVVWNVAFTTMLCMVYHTSLARGMGYTSSMHALGQGEQRLPAAETLHKYRRDMGQVNSLLVYQETYCLNIELYFMFYWNVPCF